MNSTIFRLCPVMAIASVSLITVGSAYAADASTVDPQRFGDQSVETSADWAGFYAGVHLDALAGRARIDRGAGNTMFENEEVDALFGVHLGYNFEPFGGDLSGGWMLGVEADLSVGDFRRDKVDPILGTTEVGGSFTTSARLRAGYAWERVYLYGTAGLALTDYNVKPKANTDTDISAGVAAGVGAEFAINNDWTVRVEALGYDFADQKYTFNGAQRSVKLDLATFRVGLTKRF